MLAGGQAVLAGGDLGITGERWLVGTYGDSLHSQLLVLGHHGSRTATAGAFANAVSPQWAVASSGFANAYHHPHPDVIHRLAAHGVTLLRTDTQGAWGITLAGDEMDAQQMARGKYWWQKKPFGAGE